MLPLPDIPQCLYRRSNSNSLMDRLLILQQSITNRIEQAKNQIHPPHNKAFIDSVLIEMETLNWGSNEISQYSIDCGLLEKVSNKVIS
jgi:hypothetical protein